MTGISQKYAGSLLMCLKTGTYADKVPFNPPLWKKLMCEMPVPTLNHVIWVRRPESVNNTPGLRFLYRIITEIDTTRNDSVLKKKFLLLCKSVLSSFDVNTKTFSVAKLSEYYHENGTPVSLDDDVLIMEDGKFDGIERLKLIYEGINRLRVIFVFEKDKGDRNIRLSTFHV